MRIIFAGTPAFSALSLDALIHSAHDVVGVLTQPDRPSGRGRKLTSSSVKQLALKNLIDVYQPLTLKDKDTQSLLESLNADVMVVVAYGLLLPQKVLSIPKYGCLNIHASLLPRWRGAAPIQRAIEAGDEQTGISIMQMDAGLDTGDVISMQSLTIEESDTSSSLHDKLAELGASQIVATLDKLESGQISSWAQDESGACYAAKLKREESGIDWQRPAMQIVRKIHAFNPWPGAKTHYHDIELKLTKARVQELESQTRPGEIVNSYKKIIIQTGENALEILELQKPGSRPMNSEEFLNGFELISGDQFH